MVGTTNRRRSADTTVRRLVARLGVLLMMLGATGPPAAAAAAAKRDPPTVSTNRPAGFDAMFATQRAMVDVVYGGIDRGQAMVRYSPGRVTFDNVDAVMALLPDIGDRAAVRAALAADPLAPPAARCCPRRGDDERTGCGRLSAGQTGVIFDQRSFSLTVFVAARYQVTQRAVARSYLLPATRAPALVGSVGATLAGTGDDRDYTLQSHLVASRAPRGCAATCPIHAASASRRTRWSPKWIDPACAIAAG